MAKVQLRSAEDLRVVLMDMEKVFRGEWEQISALERNLVASDYIDALIEDRCSATEYARRIGKGNLAAYADCLSVA